MGGYARRRWKRETTLVPCHTALNEFVILEVVGATTVSLMFEQSNSVSVGSMLIGSRADSLASFRSAF